MNIIYDALDTAIYRVTFKMFSYFCLACTGPESELQHHNYQRSKIPSSLKKKYTFGHLWLAPVMLATQEAEIRKISVQSQPRPKVHKTQSQKTLHKNRAGTVAQV
jgi:hypothetical protein